MTDDNAILVWRGAFARLPRPMTPESVRSIATAAGLLFALTVPASLPIVVGWVRLSHSNRAGLALVEVGGVMTSVALLSMRAVSSQRLERAFPAVAAAGFATSPALLALAVIFVGPSVGTVALYYVEVPIMAFYILRRGWALVVTGYSMIGYAAALVVLDNPPAPATQFINLLAAAVATGVLIGSLANRLDRTRRDLADLNQHLEQRVTERVDELERAGRLRRFLSPQIAEVVTSEGADELLAPHRCEVAVLFVDLRGFTHFTNAVDADHVMRVLADYYRAVGSILDAHGATIGGFDGDGVMAYIGDPVPVDKAAREALVVAREIAGELDGLLDGWSAADARLGYGIGVAFGVATLGVVGYEGRSDYTPVGAVVNLASRLCADALPGEIVIDDEVRKTAGVRRPKRRADVDLKGFGFVPTYAVPH